MAAGFGLVVLIVLPALVFLAIVIGVSALSSRHARRREAIEPCCGGCRYPVKGLPTFICPECGEDLRVVGILSPWIAPPRSPVWAVFGWSVLILLVGWLITAVAWNCLPRSYSRSHKYTLGHPKSDAYRQVVIECTGQSYTRSVPCETLLISLVPKSGDVLSATIDLDDLSYKITRPGGEKLASGDRFDLAALESLLASGGIDTKDQQVRAEAGDILQLVQTASMDMDITLIVADHFQSRGSSSTAGSGSGRRVGTSWFPAAAIGLWIVLWLWGVRRLTKRRLPQAVQAPSQA